MKSTDWELSKVKAGFGTIHTVKVTKVTIGFGTIHTVKGTIL